MSLNIDGTGDLKINDNITAGYSTWSSSKIATSAGGDVSSSISSSVIGAVPIFDGITGKIIKSSGVICNTSNNLTGIGNITCSNFIKSGGTSSQILLADGTTNSTALSSIATNTTTLNNATSSNTASTIVKRDASGNFNGSRITGTKLQANTIIVNNDISNNLSMNTNEMTSLTGVGNVLYGPSCGISITTGNSNTFMGYRSGLSLVSSNYNCGFGQDALRNCISANNTAIGGSSSTNITTGSSNTSIGNQSLFSNVSGSECVAVGSDALNQNLSSYNTAVGARAGNTATQYSNTTSLGFNAMPDASNQVRLGSTGVTEVKSSGTYNGAGYKTPTGTASGVLCADGSVNSTIISNITNLKDISNWRYQTSSYYGSDDKKDGTFAPTATGVDGMFFMNHLGNVLNVIATADANTRSRKYRVSSLINSPANGAVSGWLGGLLTPPILIKQGWKIVFAFGLADTTTQAAGPTRTMIGLFQSTTAPVLNATTTVSSITTQSMGIIQESGENVWSFNTRGSASSTKVASTISCATTNSTWYVLEMINYVNSNDIVMTLTDQDAGSATQTFTCGTTSTLANTGQCYIQLQRNMCSATTGSAVLQTASFRLWQAN